MEPGEPGQLCAVLQRRVQAVIFEAFAAVAEPERVGLGQAVGAPGA